MHDKTGASGNYRTSMNSFRTEKQHLGGIRIKHPLTLKKIVGDRTNVHKTQPKINLLAVHLQDQPMRYGSEMPCLLGTYAAAL